MVFDQADLEREINVESIMVGQVEEAREVVCPYREVIKTKISTEHGVLEIIQCEGHSQLKHLCFEPG